MRDMQRWIEAAAKADCIDDQCGTPCGSCKATAGLVIIAFLKAAAADGVKLTPRDATPAMQTARSKSIGEMGFVKDYYPDMHDEAPDYISDFS